MADLFESRYAVKPSAVRTPPAPPAPLPDPTSAFTQRAAALGIAVKTPPVVDQERTDNIVRPKTPPVAIKSSSLLPSSAEFTPRSKTRVRFDPSLEISSPGKFIPRSFALIPTSTQRVLRHCSHVNRVHLPCCELNASPKGKY